MKICVMQHIKKLTVYLLLIPLLLCMSLFVNAQTTSSSNESMRILYISSYSPSFVTFNDQLQGVIDGLSDANSIIDIEYMDTKRIHTDKSIQHFYDSLSHKLEELPKYDMVIVADDNALNFILNYKETLFKETPIIFMGINNIENAINASKDPYITGVVESASIKETIKVASTLKPNATNVVALVDSTTSGQADLINYYSLESEFNHLNFNDIDLTNMNFDSFKSTLNQLTNNDIVLLLSVYQDSSGTAVTFDDGLIIILENCSQPIFHPYLHGLDAGILGGKVISHYDQGKSVSEIISLINAGEDVSNIPLISESPNKYYFNYDVLHKYHLNESLLPKESILLNKELTFWELYYNYIIIAFIIFLLQLAFIISLRLNIRKRKKVEYALHLNKEDLLETNKKLVNTNDSLIATNEELTTALEEIEMQDQKIYDLIYIDSLSGLKNRFAMAQHIDSMTNTSLTTLKLSILFIDIDNFKYINDTYGHGIGDKVIQSISSILNKLNDDRVTVGRFGGDEFLIVIKDPSNDYFLKGIIQYIEKELSKQISIDNLKFYLTVSMGISHYPQDGDNRLELIRKADIALYKAKNLGKNRSVTYSDALHKDQHEKFILQDALINAIKNEEFYLNFQPYINPNTQKLIGYEALIRWNNPEIGYVSPYKLITTAEEMGLIIQISNWVLKTACLFIKKLNAILNTTINISVNISAYQLADQNFYKNTMKIIDSTGVNPEHICLEVTETLLIESIENGIDAIKKFKKKGIRIAIDDFGTGYSSLKYFKDLPASIIKIDKSFVDNIDIKDFDFHLINTMTKLAHQRNMTVVAEGVETESQLAALKKLDCDLIQGYLFSKPLSEEDAIEFAKNKIKIN